MSTDRENIRWGFIGCGDVVQRKSGPAFNDVSDSSISAIMRRDLESAKESAEMFGASHWYDNVEDLVNDDTGDAVYIATPPGLHHNHAIACLNAGKPVYIEKPFTRNLREAKDLVERFDNAKVPLFVAHYRRALPVFNKIKELLDNGVIGQVLEVDMRVTRQYRPAERGWGFETKLSGGGKFFDIAPHSIDILVYLFGDFTAVNGAAASNNGEYSIEDLVVLSFMTDNGVLGTANFNMTADKKGDRVHVYGTDGEIEFSMHDDGEIIVKHDGKIEKIETTLPKYIEEPMIKTVVDELLGRGVCSCHGKDALETVRIIDIVLDDFYDGRQDNFWERR
jgi:predicted dehydrogenase